MLVNHSCITYISGYRVSSVINYLHGPYTGNYLRLGDGQNQWEGRVEIWTGKIWGTISSYSWDSQDAAVVCQQLGFSANGKKYAMCYSPLLVAEKDMELHIILGKC